MKINKDISVVIPTLGNEIVFQTIMKLNAGTLIPKEILICIPEAYAYNVNNIKDDNVRVIKTSTSGQVAQRSEGFEMVKYQMVLQLDDDIFLNEDTLFKLAFCLTELGQGNIVAPVYNDKDTGKCLHEFKIGIKGFIKNIYSTIICGAPFGKKRMGKFTSLGICYGIDPVYVKKNIFETDWLPGGCVLGYKEDLIKDKFYPFKGKAYLEDIIHSILRKNKKLCHFVITNAISQTASQKTSTTFNFKRNDLEARKFVVGLVSGSRIKLSIWSFFDYLKLRINFLLNIK